MKTTVSMQDVVDALDSVSDESSSYVNSVTGEVRTVMNAELSLAEEEMEQGPDLPEWQRDAIAAAKEILESNDWLELPSKFDIHEWEIMDQFGRSLTGQQQEEVRDAIRGRGAFRIFKATIRRLGIEDDWFAYKYHALEEIARSWLEEHDLQPVAVQPDAAPGGASTRR